jgi:hypothetical protein
MYRRTKSLCCWLWQCCKDEIKTIVAFRERTQNFIYEQGQFLKGPCHEIFDPLFFLFIKQSPEPWFTVWSRFAHGFVFVEKIGSKIANIESRCVIGTAGSDFFCQSSPFIFTFTSWDRGIRTLQTIISIVWWKKIEGRKPRDNAPLTMIFYSPSNANKHLYSKVFRYCVYLC